MKMILGKFAFTLIPIFAAIIGAIIAVKAKPGPQVVSGVQHFAAGVVFAAAAGEILPDVMHQGSPLATFIGGTLGVSLMLALKQVEQRIKGPVGLMTMVGIDILIDGLVLGIAFSAGAKAGLLLTVALTIEIVFLGLTVANELGETDSSLSKIVGKTAILVLMLPLGMALSAPVTLLSPVVVSGFFAFGLMALLYLVTEELLIEAHETPDTAITTAMFFAGFLILLLLEEAIG